MNPRPLKSILALTAALFLIPPALRSEEGTALSRADWVVLVDGTSYNHSVETALQGVYDAIPPGQTCTIASPQSTVHFTRTDGERSFQEILGRVRSSLFLGADRLTTLQKESRLLTDQMDDISLRHYVGLKRQFYTLYGESHRRLWDLLAQTPFKAGARVVLLIQEVFFPTFPRDRISSMNEDPQLRGWTLDIQTHRPYEAKRKEVKKVIGQLLSGGHRVDTFYLQIGLDLKEKGRSSEASRALFRGASKLSKASSGVVMQAGSDPAQVSQALQSKP